MNLSRKSKPFTASRSGVGWLIALAISVSMLTAVPAYAQTCSPFLEVLGPDRQGSVLSLTTCEVIAAERWAENPGSTVWQLTAAAQQRWTAALKDNTLTLLLLDAQLRTRHLAKGLQSGPLLNRISARLVRPASWRWDARRGEIAMVEATTTDNNLCRESASLIFWFGTLDVVRGENLNVQVKVVYAASDIRSMPNSCVDAWRIESAHYATVDAQGLVQISDNAPDGTKVKLIALVGPREVKGEMRVVDLQRSPLIGTWQQVSETPCDSGVARTPLEPIREFKLDGSGNFSVTKTPFEAYKDYSGTYTHDAASGATRFSVVSGNKVPKDLKLAGRATSANSTLELSELSLWPPKDGVPICRLQFTLQSR